jgi:hypothetical protein
MKALIAIVLPVILLFGLVVTAHGQQTAPSIDWNHFQGVSPLLYQAVQQLSKEGYTVRFDSARIRNFADLFVAAFIPAVGGKVPTGADFGTLGLMVIFTRVPGPDNLVVAQVVRIEYQKNIYTKKFEIVGDEETLDKDQLLTVNKKTPVLLLIVDQEGQIQQETNNLLLRTGQRLEQECTQNAFKGVQAKCDSLKEKDKASYLMRGKSEADYLRCVVTGWLWAQYTCSKYTGKG